MSRLPIAPDPYSCPTCADAADRVTIVGLKGSDAEVSSEDGSRSQVAVDLIDTPREGDTILVHQGVAIARIAEEQTA